MAEGKSSSWPCMAGDAHRAVGLAVSAADPRRGVRKLEERVYPGDYGTFAPISQKLEFTMSAKGKVNVVVKAVGETGMLVDRVDFVPLR